MYARVILLTSALIALASASELTAPFIFYTTAQVSLPSLPLHNITTHDIHHFIGGAFSTCPTRKYLVVYQPGIQSTDYDDTASTPNLHSYATSSTGIKVLVQGQVWLDGIMNTILMDCLHHGITRVESLDVERMVRDAASYKLPLGGPTYLATESRKSSILYAHMPAISWIGRSRRQGLQESDDFVQGVIEQWFGGEDFTIAYITEPMREEDVKEYEELVGTSGYDATGKPLVADWEWVELEDSQDIISPEQSAIFDAQEIPIFYSDEE